MKITFDDDNGMVGLFLGAFGSLAIIVVLVVGILHITSWFSITNFFAITMGSAISLSLLLGINIERQRLTEVKS